MKDLAEDVYLSTKTAIMEDNSRNEFIGGNFNSDGKISGSVESSTELSLKEKVANFISSGELDPIEGMSLVITNIIVLLVIGGSAWFG